MTEEDRLDVMNELMLEMLVDLDGIKRLASYIEGEQFSRRFPQKA